MGNSGIVWIDIVFDWCVILLYDVAGAIGITYEEINVYLFVFIGPMLLLASLFLNIWQFNKLRKQLTEYMLKTTKKSTLNRF